MASQILTEVVTSDRVKLQFGANKRLEIKTAIQRGEKVDGYRVDWHRSTRNAVITTILTACREFNDTYKYDMISVGDILDVLASTENAYLQAVKKKIDPNKD